VNWTETDDRPILLELFASEGGSTLGYQKAGWRVCALDNVAKHARRNPAEAWLTGDAIQALDTLLAGGELEFATGGGWTERIGLTGHHRGPRLPALPGLHRGPAG